MKSLTTDTCTPPGWTNADPRPFVILSAATTDEPLLLLLTTRIIVARTVVQDNKFKFISTNLLGKGFG